jgi:hypothetical protein
MISTTNSRIKENFFNSYNIRVFTPEATLYVIITEDHQNNPTQIVISGGKGTQTLQLWCEAISNLINKMWAVGVTTNEIILALDTNYGTRYATNDHGVKIYSGPLGIQWALKQYLHLRVADPRRIHR